MVLSCTILLSPKPKKLVCVMTVLLESIRKSSRRYGGERDLAFGCNDDSFLGFQFNFEIVAQNWIFRDWIISDSIWIWSSKRNVSTTLLLVRGCTVHHRHSKKCPKIGIIMTDSFPKAPKCRSLRNRGECPIDKSILLPRFCRHRHS